ncbi:hypothetical protein D1872_337580 [compost metagenome]
MMTPTGWLRPIRATAMPVKPKPSTKLSLIWCSSPCSTLRAKKPASMPEITMARITTLG